jgi:hypothetical protein
MGDSPSLSDLPPEQPPLFAFVDDDNMLLSTEELRVRFHTGTTAEKLEWKRNAILMLLGAGFPVRTIEVELHASHHVVVELAKRSAEKVSHFNKEFASILLSTGARWVGLARTKENEASFKDVMIGAGIVMQHARELQAMGTGLDGEKEFVKEATDRAAVAARLREWFDAGVSGSPLPTDLEANSPELIGNGLAKEDAQRVEGGVEAPRPGQLKGMTEAPAATDGEGGGADGRPDGITLMGEVSGDCSVKGSRPRPTWPPPPAPAELTKNAAPSAEPTAGTTPGGTP